MKIRVSVPHDAAGFVRGGLFGIELKPDGPGQRKVANTAIGQPRISADFHPQKNMRAGRNIVPESLPADTAAEECDRKPHRLKHRGKIAILLETISSPAVVDQLFLDGRQVQQDSSSQQDFHILEGDGLNVRRSQRV